MLGERIREEREGVGLSQAAFAEVAGAARRTVVDWEAGKTSPTAAQLAALAVTGIDILYIVTGEREGAPPLKPDEQLLLDRYRDSPQSLRDAALRVLLGGTEQPSTSTRKIKVSGQGHQVAGGKIINKAGGRK